MTNEPPAPPPPSLDADDVTDLLQRFVELGNRSSEAIVDDLVRVRVGAAMNVLAVEILDPVLDPAMKRRLETAVVGAVNTALQRSALAAGQALGEFERRKKAGKTSE
jgi:DNA-binding protein YbaB